MERVYLDNSATSFPKPEPVKQAVMRYFEFGAGNPGRTASEDALAMERSIYNTRLALANFFHFDAPDHVIFTKNITEAINLVLFSVLKNGDRVIVSEIEHNAVLRPLEVLKEKRGIEVIEIPLDEDGVHLDTERLDAALKTKPRLMALSCASNVSGDVLALKEAAEAAKNHGVPILLDTAQAAGVTDIDFKALGVAFLAFTGHKSLLGPQGIGGLLIDPKRTEILDPLIYGGTGSYSELLTQPTIMPDRFESGTGNLLGILGLEASLGTLREKGIETIASHERHLIRELEKPFEDDHRVKLLNRVPASKRVGVLSIDFKERDNAVAAHLLAREFGIVTRVGLHCAPAAHKAFGTYPKGTVRFSVSPYTTIKEIEYTAQSIKKLLTSDF